ncbi:MAG: FHA domain-containing protein [Oscillospiraceae bacterium]|nr:FHA domain-containing protein [Oscillospiraceae bacterium]
MKLVTCPNGHRYDPSLTSECPECAMLLSHTVMLDPMDVDMGGGMGGYNKTVDVGSGSMGGGLGGYPGGTVMLEEDDPIPDINLGGGFKPFEPVTPNKQKEDAIDPETAAGSKGSYGETVFVDHSGEGQEPSFKGRKELPITGWLVCIDGPEKGKDYRLHTDNNYIGRGPRMDVVIVGDNTVSFEQDSRLTYDPEEHEFFFTQVNGKTIARKNGKRVDGTVEIVRGDRLKIGQGTFIFIPLCGDGFEWE